MHTWTPTVTPELESTAFLYARSILTDAERLERRIRELERELAAVQQCDHAVVITDLRAQIDASEAERGRLVAAFGPEQTQPVYRIGRLRLDTETATVELDGQTAYPTPVEMRFLIALARYQEQLLFPSRFYRLVYGKEHKRAGSGISVHWNRLRARLAVIGADRYLVTRRGHRSRALRRGISAACEREAAE